MSSLLSGSLHGGAGRLKISINNEHKLNYNNINRADAKDSDEMIRVSQGYRGTSQKVWEEKRRSV